MKTIATLAATILIGLGLHATPASAAERDSGSVVEQPRIVAFGDSITFGGGSSNPDRQSWPSRIGAIRAAVPSGCLVTVNGPTKPAIVTYGRVVLSKRPDIVIVAYGMNDLIHSTGHEIYAGLRKVERRNTARGIVTYVATLTPVGERVWGLNETRTELNDLIRSRFAAWRVLDFDAALRTRTGRLDARFDSGDNLHPNARGYKVMARLVADKLGLNPVIFRP